MAFRKKVQFILAENPDIIIVPECEHPDKLNFEKEVTKPTDLFWHGKNPNKGLGVFSYSDFKIEPLTIYHPKFEYVLPLSVSNNKTKLIIFAIWAQKPEKHDCYTEHIWNAVHFYINLLEKESVILVGDFNSNSIWDKPNRIYNHSNLVSFLKNMKIHSTYHTYNNEEQGKETVPTLFMHRKMDRPLSLSPIVGQFFA